MKKMPAEMSAIDVVTISFALSSILIGAAIFLLGFYISDRNKGIPKEQRSPYKYLVLSLTIPCYFIIAYSLLLIISEATTSFGVFAVFCSAISLVPAIAISAIIITNWN